MNSFTFTAGMRLVDLAIPMIFNGPQPSAYGVPPASSAPYSGDGWMLDTRRGGSCNCDVLTIAPHCNGTHTECVGHITGERIAIAEALPEPFLAATLISVTPDGRAITAPSLKLEAGEWLEALIIRTLPNDDSKTTRSWENNTTPFISTEAMAKIVSLGVRHLLVDLPSVDPLHDDGMLAAHRIFWGLPSGSKERPADVSKTITELIYVPNDVSDGRYVLNLQVPRLMTDAAPSRPVLFC